MQAEARGEFCSRDQRPGGWGRGAGRGGRVPYGDTAQCHPPGLGTAQDEVAGMGKSRKPPCPPQGDLLCSGAG